MTNRSTSCPSITEGRFRRTCSAGRASLTADQSAKITAMKWLIYDGFQAALAGGVPTAKAGILVDEQFGADILRDAAKRHYVTACPAEKSGQDEFDFEYGDDFDHHIETFQPTFCKVLVRYNPEGDPAMNRRQAVRLKRLSDYLHSGGPSRFMFELLVPATPEQLERFGGRKKEYDRQLRPELMMRAITELQDAGIEPDVWKIEGIDRPEDCAGSSRPCGAAGGIASAASSWVAAKTTSRSASGCKTAAAVPGFIGFAVGRTSFWGPLTDWKEGRIAREAAVSEIARRYREWVDIFESAGAAAGAACPGEIRR